MPNKIDIKGNRFGRLTAMEEVDPVRTKSGTSVTRWLCKCDCGNEIIVRTRALRSGNTKSCGCLFHENLELITSEKREDMCGKRFGRLTVLEFAGLSKGRKALWKCICDCGGICVETGYNLKDGRAQSCGCLRAELQKRLMTTHGESHSRLYKIWTGIKERCTNPNHISFEYYGGRGISICEDWSKNFTAFQQWSIQNGYNANAERGECTIDRIDVNGMYEPSNCRWVAMSTQNRNKRRSNSN